MLLIDCREQFEVQNGNSRVLGVFQHNFTTFLEVSIDRLMQVYVNESFSTQVAEGSSWLQLENISLQQDQMLLIVRVRLFILKPTYQPTSVQPKGPIKWVYISILKKKKLRKMFEWKDQSSCMYFVAITRHCIFFFLRIESISECKISSHYWHPFLFNVSF